MRLVSLSFPPSFPPSLSHTHSDLDTTTTYTYTYMYLLKQPKEHIGVYSSLVSLVQHHDGVLLQVSINEALPQQHAVCHVLDHCLLARHILETNCIANLRSKNSQIFLLFKPEPEDKTYNKIPLYTFSQNSVAKF